jgi:hypothetical protein
MITQPVITVSTSNWIKIADLARARAAASLQAWELGQGRAHAPDTAAPAPRASDAALFANEVEIPHLVNPTPSLHIG